MTDILTSDTITFGKYKNGTLDQILKDRSYCAWLLKQDWFVTNYVYLYNRVKEYDPKLFFFRTPPISDNFLENYQLFNLTPIDELAISSISLSENEIKCYTFYLDTVKQLKQRIKYRLDTDNPYAIKAPTGWLKIFEKHTGLKREQFKEFMSSYELPNITYIVEDIKKEGGIEYKGAQAFNIAKKRSEAQELFWEKILKEQYGENLSCQYKYENCFFDFLNINTQTIFECKLWLTDYNNQQHKKYLLALTKYRIVYLIAYDGVINMEKKEIYTTDVDKYIAYQDRIPTMKDPSQLDTLIQDFFIIEVDNLSKLFGFK